MAERQLKIGLVPTSIGRPGDSNASQTSARCCQIWYRPREGREHRADRTRICARKLARSHWSAKLAGNNGPLRQCGPVCFRRSMSRCRSGSEPLGDEVRHIQTKLLPPDLGVIEQTTPEGFALRTSTAERVTLELLHLASPTPRSIRSGSRWRMIGRSAPGGHPKINVHVERLLARPAFAKAIADTIKNPVKFEALEQP